MSENSSSNPLHSIFKNRVESSSGSQGSKTLGADSLLLLLELLILETLLLETLLLDELDEISSQHGQPGLCRLNGIYGTSLLLDGSSTSHSSTSITHRPDTRFAWPYASPSTGVAVMFRTDTDTPVGTNSLPVEIA
jgi:hypothetical protein